MSELRQSARLFARTPGFTLAVSVLLQSLLFEISPQDTQAIAGTLIFGAIVASAATAVPLVRATRAAPAEGLRLEQ